MSRKLYDVWKNPQKYKFPRFPARWSSSQVKYIRNIAHHEVLANLEFVLKLYKSVPFEQDVNAAVKELKNERGAPILEGKQGRIGTHGQIEIEGSVGP